MNIFVHTFDLYPYARTDNTLNRKSADYYPPEFIQEIRFTPVIYTRIANAGKCISPRFASRYYEHFGFGTLLYCYSDKDPKCLASTACLDGTSLLSDLPMASCNFPASFSLNVKAQGEEIRSFKWNIVEGKNSIEESLVKVSHFCFVKRGDLLCCELSPLQELCFKQEAKEIEVQVFCGNTIIQDFRIIFV